MQKINNKCATPLTAEERRQLEELYRQQISSVRILARILGYECPIRTREERRVQIVDDRDILHKKT